MSYVNKDKKKGDYLNETGGKEYIKTKYIVFDSVIKLIALSDIIKFSAVNNIQTCFLDKYVSLSTRLDCINKYMLN